METKTVPLDFEVKADAEPGAFKGYGAVFGNRDLGGDIIEAGAFKSIKSTKGNRVRIALYHDLQRIVGSATVTQDSKGLLLDGQLNMNVSYARDAYELMKSGDLDGLSVGFNILRGGAEYNEKTDTRLITKAELWEVSIVAFGMNPKAKITAVKSADIEQVSSVRELEHLLKDAGFSRNLARAIANNGFKGIQCDAGDPAAGQCDADELTSAMLGNLKSHLLNYTP